MTEEKPNPEDEIARLTSVIEAVESSLLRFGYASDLLSQDYRGTLRRIQPIEDMGDALRALMATIRDVANRHEISISGSDVKSYVEAVQSLSSEIKFADDQALRATESATREKDRWKASFETLVRTMLNNKP